METLVANRAWLDILQTLRDYIYQPRLLYLEKLSTTIIEKGKHSIIPVCLNVSSLSKIPALQMVREGKLQYQEISHRQENTRNT